MADRRPPHDPVDYIDCEVPEDMTLREWRFAHGPGRRAKRLRGARLRRLYGRVSTASSSSR